MSDSEGESSSYSLQIDHMSVSDQDIDASHEDDMPSAEVYLPGDVNNREADSLSESSVSGEDHMKTAIDQSNVEVQQVPIAENAMVVKIPPSKKSANTTDTMSASYSEITAPPEYKTDPVEACEAAIENLAMEGMLMKDGNMVHFAAKNLETKIRLSSPDPSDNNQANHSLVENQTPYSYLDSTCLLLLEKEARNIASSVDGLTEHLAVSLHTISAVTAESLAVYKDSVCKTCDAMDANIKSMYQLMAKCEELSKAMAPLYKQAEQVKEIKKLLDIYENI